MTKKRFLSLVLAIALGGGTFATATSTLKPAALFTDHMVLQRNRPIRIWGKAEPGKTVTVALLDNKADAKVDADGNWQAELPARPEGGPYTVSISEGDQHAYLSDVLIGDVWVCGGQSNMAFELKRGNDAKQEIAKANFPDIRMFTVGTDQSSTPLNEIRRPFAWRPCTPDVASTFSAVGYFFGREIHRQVHVPIGLLESDWGGTPAEAWTSFEGLEKIPQYRKWVESVRAGKTSSAWRKWYRKHTPKKERLPGLLYNAMINPLIQFPITGVIWYQGEANATRGKEYETIFPNMITDWRSKWNQGNFPFLFVQLAGYIPPHSKPGDTHWPELRDAQRKTLSLPATAMASAADIGEMHNIHPKDKQDVGKRLALAGLALAYNRPIEYMGPLFKDASTSGGEMIVSFTHTAAGLKAKSGNLTGFEVAGDDGKFYPAAARISGAAEGSPVKSVIVQSDQVPTPVSVRYDWQDFPTGNLYNSEDLPASCFQFVKKP